MNDFTGRVRREEQGSPQGTVRTITVALDTAQYQVGGGLGAGPVQRDGGAGAVVASWACLWQILDVAFVA